MLALSMCPKALRKLASIMEDPTAAALEQIRAAEAILDRGLGKVVELPDLRRWSYNPRFASTRSAHDQR